MTVISTIHGIETQAFSSMQIESPIERALELLGDRYSLLIIFVLQQFEKLRFVELEQQITGISPRTLSARLKHLERYGLINRNQFPCIPPKVEYSLTPIGKDLSMVLQHMQQWTNQWFPYQPDRHLDLSDTMSVE